jgi:hypothetical protein
LCRISVIRHPQDLDILVALLVVALDSVDDNDDGDANDDDDDDDDNDDHYDVYFVRDIVPCSSENDSHLLNISMIYTSCIYCHDSKVCGEEN